MIDTHAHITDPKLDGVRAEILSALGKGLSAIVEVGFDYESSASAVKLANSDRRVFCAVGTHPHDATTLTDAHLEYYREIAKNPKVVAIGEIGLDYHYENSNKSAQKTAFLAGLRLADEVKLPVILHVRDAFPDTLEILSEQKKLLNSGILFHCFAGSNGQVRELSKKYDPYYAFGGVVTFAKSSKSNVIRAVPRDRLLLETDCPYLAPEPYRGQINRPEYVKFVAEKVSEILGITTNEVIEITTNNALRFFSKMVL